MRNLSDTDKTQKIQFIADLTKEATVVEEAANEVNEKIATLNEKIAAYNNTLKNVRDFVDATVNDMQEFHSKKAESWQESDEGGLYQEWIDSWEGVDLDDLRRVDEIDPIEPMHGQDLEELSDSP